MLTTSKVNGRKRDKLFECTLTTVRDAIDRYEQSNMQEIVYLRPYQSILQDGWNRFQSIQNELYELEEADFAQQLEALKLYLPQANRIRELMEGKRPSNTSTPKCSSDPSNNVQRSNNNGHTPPTEIVASSQMPIPSHSTRSSQHDIRNMSTTRDLTTTFAASASQPSDSTLHNVLNQPIAPDPLDREERNPVQDNDGHTPPTENITSHVTPDMDIISESHSTGPNVKSSPSQWPKGATPASDPNRDNLHVITIMTNHLIVGSFQNAPSDLNTCPLRPQIATTDKSFTTTFSLESALAPTTPGHSPMSTLALDAGSQDPSEQPHKSSWPPTDELARRDALAHFLPGPNIGTRLRRGHLVMLTSSDYSRPPKQGRLLRGDAGPVQPPNIIERTRSEWVIGGSLVPQSTMTSFTLPQLRQERGCQNNMQCFRGSDVAEVQRKEGETFSRSYHEAICERWGRNVSIQAELDDHDEEKYVHSEGTSDMYLAIDS